MINDVPLNYVEVGKRDGIPIIFLHGFPFSHEMWKPQLDVIGDRYRAIAYDIRGHGESYVGDGQFTIEGHVDDLIAVLDHFKIQQSIIVGLSMGGYIALRALERNPDRFMAAALCDTRSEADTTESKLKRFESIRSVKEHGSAVYAEAFVKAVFDQQTFTRMPDIIRSIQNTISRTTPLSIAGTLLALASRTDTTPSLAAIKIPTLILVGEHDTTTPPAAAQALHERIKGSVLHIVPNAAHMSNMENPAYFNEKLFEFLVRVS
jgi:pimeloyl-ACP methyl ester carboxylesterase